MKQLKIILSVFFLLFGIATAYLTFDLANKDSFGNIESFGNSLNPSTSAGGGVDSSNDGVAIGLGIISGFSFLSSALLLKVIQ